MTMTSKEIQYDLFPTAPALNLEAETLELLRPHKWAHGEETELPLVSIELKPDDEQWMWATCLNSHNGSGQGSRALPKWGKFASTKVDALLKAADEVRAFMHRATESEQERITLWLGEVVSSAISSR